MKRGCWRKLVFLYLVNATQHNSLQHCVLKLSRCIPKTNEVGHCVNCSVVAPRTLGDTSLTVSFVYSTHRLRINVAVCL